MKPLANQFTDLTHDQTLPNITKHHQTQVENSNHVLQRQKRIRILSPACNPLRHGNTQESIVNQHVHHVYTVYGNA